MSKRQRRKLLLAATLVITIVLMLPTIASAAVGDGAMSTGYTKIEEISKKIAPGISEKRIVMNTPKGDQQNIFFLCEVDLSNKNTGVMASYKDHDPGAGWGLQTLPDQIKKAEKKTGANVVAAVNGDYFDMSNGAPIGALVMDGKHTIMQMAELILQF